VVQSGGEHRKSQDYYYENPDILDAGDTWVRPRPTLRLPSPLAISLGIIPADPAYAGQIRAAQVAAIVRLTPVAMLASCLNALILLAALQRARVLSIGILIWAALLLGIAAYYAAGWATHGRRAPPRSASPRAIRRAVLHGALYGAVWGAVPAMTWPGAPAEIQVLVGCLTGGMMASGALVLSTVPLAGWAYVAMIAIGGMCALLQAGSPVDLNLAALLVVYTGVIVTNLSWNAHLFVKHFLTAVRLQDETEARERAQAQMAHAQRMTALGQLAGGIAHDFNNILQAVAGNAVSIAHRAPEGGPVHLLSTRILDAAERGGAISRRLLAFAHQDRLSAEPVEPAELLNAVRDMLQPTFDAGISFQIDAPPGLPWLLADRAQLDTVLVNLTTNARDAMPRGGVLTLRAACVNRARDGGEPPLDAGTYVVLSVTDTGTGMDDVTLARATEPFFTTKAKGRGTGLGLSMAKGFAEQSGGAFAIVSTPGEGTTATLWLPRADADLPARPKPSPPAQGVRAQRHVLLVDDDDLVRDAMIDSLADSGFVLIGAANARAALAHIDRGARIDVLVSDFSMPGMNGIDLIRAAQLRRPGLAAILLTGHVADVTSHPDGGEGGNFILVRKPVRAAELARCFAAALEAAA
jgi:signal transduction histidine kinase/CheY-like chemotaxis protein